MNYDALLPATKDWLEIDEQQRPPKPELVQTHAEAALAGQEDRGFLREEIFRKVGLDASY